MKIQLNGYGLKISDVVKIAREKVQIEIGKEALPKIAAARDFVENAAKSRKPVYGINTGFGKFADTAVSEKDCKLLQKNLIVSHACGVGEPLPPEIVRGVMALRINALVSGYSGISPGALELMKDMLNNDVVPVVPSKGSLGASGDLAPLAHVVLPMLGIGEVYLNGERMPAGEAFKKAGLKHIELTAKEGLALINGTQFMCAIATLAAANARNLIKTADVTAALTVEALTGIADAYDPRIHKIRGQQGQIDCASNLLKLLQGSGLVSCQGELRVQDAYSIRCVPQIHGASRDSITFVDGIVSREINAVTDNPLIFFADGESLSGGNFHGQYLSMTMDFLGIALSEIANVSERRTERLVNPQLSNGLPPFLIKNGGLNSGFMITQYAAAALVSENKVLSHPACVDSITSSANQEDHVSMGMTAALKAREISENVTQVLGIELFNACQAAELRGAGKLSPAGRAVFDAVREKVPFIGNDVYMSPEIAKCADIVRSGAALKAAEKIVGELK